MIWRSDARGLCVVPAKPKPISVDRTSRVEPQSSIECLVDDRMSGLCDQIGELNGLYAFEDWEERIQR